MKTQYKLGLLAVGIVAVTSCAKHDPIADTAELGQPVPTCYWSVGSTVCKAGESFSFSGKYYTDPNHTPSHSEVWYNVVRSRSYSATAKLAGSALSFSKIASAVDTVRESQSIVRIDHDESFRSVHPLDSTKFLEEYDITGNVPTSQTLAPVDWKNVSTWDQGAFESYFPKGFDKEFCDSVVNLLTNNDSYYNALKNVYFNYPFSNEAVAAVNEQLGTQLPTDIKFDASDPMASTTDKSSRWYDTAIDPTGKNKDQAPIPVVIGYYYEDENGVVVECPAPVEGKDCFEVYDAAPWLFSRYDFDNGGPLCSVRAEYLLAFKALFSQISFDEWIYDSTERKYTAVYSLMYSLDAQFKVYDTDGNVGVAADTRTISIN